MGHSTPHLFLNSHCHLGLIWSYSVCSFACQPQVAHFHCRTPRTSMTRLISPTTPIWFLINARILRPCCPDARPARPGWNMVLVLGRLTGCRRCSAMIRCYNSSGTLSERPTSLACSHSLSSSRGAHIAVYTASLTS
ncbi:hypothetical protein BDZ89DRAFT_465292 [Hymenopellis radicata]|nr:hypothetical protein BDZ89DRAFT_465292 [Hymenopellis radicata]